MSSIVDKSPYHQLAPPAPAVAHGPLTLPRSHLRADHRFAARNCTQNGAELVQEVTPDCFFRRTLNHAFPPPFAYNANVEASDRFERERRDQRFAMRLSLAIGVVMLVGKVTAYLLTGSAAILSDAAESVIHVVAVSFAAFSLW
jgi:hypothetical protein